MRQSLLTLNLDTPTFTRKCGVLLYAAVLSNLVNLEEQVSGMWEIYVLQGLSWPHCLGLPASSFSACYMASLDFWVFCVFSILPQANNARTFPFSSLQTLWQPNSSIFPSSYFKITTPNTTRLFLSFSEFVSVIPLLYYLAYRVSLS